MHTPIQTAPGASIRLKPRDPKTEDLIKQHLATKGVSRCRPGKAR
jgi:hypothetical protein